jgi:hypothetical protein
MGKFWFLVLLAGVLYVGWEIRTKGMDGAFGGMFAPLESVNQAEAPMATSLTPLAQSADVPTQGSSGGQAVRDRAAGLRDRSRSR